MLPRELIEEMQRHQIEITITPQGQPLLSAPTEPPLELLQKIEEYAVYTLEYAYRKNKVCGGCRFWDLAPDWGSLMGTCSRPSSAFEGSKPLAIHLGCQCSAYKGQGFRPKGLEDEEVKKTG